MRSSVTLFVLGFSTLALSSPQEDAARGVIQRLLGDRVKSFSFKQIPSERNLDRYMVLAHSGQVTIQGTTTVAMCRGAYDYLKEACHCLVTWDGDQLKLPARLPDFRRDSGFNPNEYRHYFNVCTFGYTTAFWDWKRWEREIDWMALHGINMPLAMNGMEKVWQTVWRQYGLSDADIRAHFVGPAFRPWQWMGNVDAHAGPMPQDWIDRQAALQQKILDRELSMGMRPVTPAFASFIPGAFAKKLDPTHVRRSSGWCGFEPTYMLDPRDPLFAEIGERYIKEYKKQYGATAGLYLADVYNEMTPQVGKTTKLDDLHDIAKAVHQSIKRGDPNGKWVMQGWLFYNESSFWGDPEVGAYLDAVPDEDMILLDLAAEVYEVWRHHASFRKKPYIWNMLHNYGQNTTLTGDLRGVATYPAKAITDPDRGGLIGMGLTMEGIEQNSVMYELMCDMMWRTTPVKPEDWLGEYGVQRYGIDSVDVRKAWTKTMGDMYLGKVQNDSAGYTRRPSLGAIDEPGDEIVDTRIRMEALMALPISLRTNPLWQRDMVDVGKRYGEQAVRAATFHVVEAIESKDRSRIQKARAEFNTAIDLVDRLLMVVPQHRMDRWVAMARACVGAVDKALLEANARLQVTVWGGPILNDYAAKEWAGLVSGFYKPRWNRFFDALEAGSFNQDKFSAGSAEWELKWCYAKQAIPTSQTVNLEAVVRELLANGRKFEPTSTDRGIAVGKRVTTDGGTEQDHSPDIITDGRTSGRYWAAGPGPHWVQIDLGFAQRISKVQVFPYVDGERYYQYTVETSFDGKNWTMVADMSANTEKSTRRGKLHEFAPAQVRYVRVNMLHNSANPSMHLHEVRVSK